MGIHSNTSHPYRNYKNQSLTSQRLPILMNFFPLCVHYHQMYECSFLPETSIREWKILTSILAASSPRLLPHKGHPQCELPFPHRWCWGKAVPPRGPRWSNWNKQCSTVPHITSYYSAWGKIRKITAAAGIFLGPWKASLYPHVSLVGQKHWDCLLHQPAAFNYKILSLLHLPGQNSTRRSCQR